MNITVSIASIESIVRSKSYSCIYLPMNITVSIASIESTVRSKSYSCICLPMNMTVSIASIQSIVSSEYDNFRYLTVLVMFFSFLFLIYFIVESEADSDGVCYLSWTVTVYFASTIVGREGVFYLSWTVTVILLISLWVVKVYSTDRGQ